MKQLEKARPGRRWLGRPWRGGQPSLEKRSVDTTKKSVRWSWAHAFNKEREGLGGNLNPSERTIDRQAKWYSKRLVKVAKRLVFQLEHGDLGAESPVRHKLHWRGYLELKKAHSREWILRKACALQNLYPNRQEPSVAWGTCTLKRNRMQHGGPYRYGKRPKRAKVPLQEVASLPTDLWKEVLTRVKDRWWVNKWVCRVDRDAEITHLLHATRVSKGWERIARGILDEIESRDWGFIALAACKKNNVQVWAYAMKRNRAVVDTTNLRYLIRYKRWGMLKLFALRNGTEPQWRQPLLQLYKDAGIKTRQVLEKSLGPNLHKLKKQREALEGNPPTHRGGWD